MRTSNSATWECAGLSVYWIKSRNGLAALHVALLLLFGGVAASFVETARATDLGSAQTAYTLTPEGNPYTIIAGAIIDTTADGTNSIFADRYSAGTWALTNNGTVLGGFFSVEFVSSGVIVNNGSLISRVNTSLALYDGGEVTNSAGAVIIGRNDAVYADAAGSSVTNAGDIGGSAADLTKTQSAIHLPEGGTVTNLATGKILAFGATILSSSPTMVQNAGQIVSFDNTAIDLTLESDATTGTGNVVSNSGLIAGGGGTAIMFGPGNNTLMMTGTSIIDGIVDASTHSASGTNTLILDGTSAGRFDISSIGATAQYRGFNTLRKSDSGIWTLNGTNAVDQNWLVSGGGIVVAGQLSGSVIATPGATGIGIDVMPGGAVHASAGNAVSVNGASQVNNGGTIVGAGAGAGGVAVSATGTGTSVANTGSIAATGANGIGVAIDAPGGAASLTNAAGASITSALGVGVLAGSGVSVVNSGIVDAEGLNGAGVAIDAPSGPTRLQNMPGGSIRGASGVLAKTGSTVSIDNAGTIAATGAMGAGVAIDAPGGAASLTNAAGASITSASGVGVQAGSNVSIKNAGSIVAEGPNGTGISIDAPAGGTSLTNQPGGSIKGASGVVALAGTGLAIVNAGVIAADGANGAGVAIDVASGPVTLTNQQGASITSASGVGVQAGSSVSILNAGTLSGNGAAVRFTGSNDLLTLDTGSTVSGELDGGNGAANALVLQGMGTLSSRATGFSTLTMQGTSWTVSGPVSVTSTSMIESGSFGVTGTLSSPSISVAPGATLTGTGTLQGALTVQGIIAPGVAQIAAPSNIRPLSVGTLSVDGSYIQSAGSRYEADLSSQGNDLISVDGAATLQGGVVLARLRVVSLAPESTYEILSTTAGLTGVFSGIASLNPFVSPTLVYDANNAYIHAQRSFQFAGGTPNQIAVEAALDHGAGGAPTRDFLSVGVDLLNLEGSPAYAALDQLSAEAYAAFSNAQFESARLGMDAIDSRLSAARATGDCERSGESSALTADNAGRACSWISVLGSTSNIDGYSTWLGQQIGLAGVISGIDFRVAPQLTIGAALAAIHGNTSTDTLPVHGQFDSYQAALYGAFVPGAYWLQTTIGYARNNDQMNRSIEFTDTPRTAMGSVDGNQYFVSLRNGIDLPIRTLGVVSPFIALEMQRVETPAFAETGADSVNLAVSGNAENSVRSVLGAQWRNGFDWLGHAWDLNGQLGWIHQYGAQTQALSASFEGAAASGFTVHGSGPLRDAAQLGVGFRVSLGQRTHAFLRYDGEFGDGGHTHGGSAGLDYRW